MTFMWIFNWILLFCFQLLKVNRNPSVLNCCVLFCYGVQILLQFIKLSHQRYFWPVAIGKIQSMFKSTYYPAHVTVLPNLSSFFLPIFFSRKRFVKPNRELDSVLQVSRNQSSGLVFLWTHQCLSFLVGTLALRRTSSHKIHGQRGRGIGTNSSERGGDTEDTNSGRRSKHHLGPTGLFIMPNTTLNGTIENILK